MSQTQHNRCKLRKLLMWVWLWVQVIVVAASHMQSTHRVFVVVWLCSGHTRLWQMSHSVNTFLSLLQGQKWHLFLLSLTARVVTGRGGFGTSATGNPMTRIAARVWSDRPFGWLRRYSSCGVIKLIARFSTNSRRLRFSFGWKSGLLWRNTMNALMAAMSSIP